MMKKDKEIKKRPRQYKDKLCPVCGRVTKHIKHLDIDKWVCLGHS